MTYVPSETKSKLISEILGIHLQYYYLLIH